MRRGRRRRSARAATANSANPAQFRDMLEDGGAVLRGEEPPLVLGPDADPAEGVAHDAVRGVGA